MSQIEHKLSQHRINREVVVSSANSMAFTWAIKSSWKIRRDQASKLSCLSVAIITHQHADESVFHHKPITYLTSPCERALLIGLEGIDITIPFSLNDELSNLNIGRFTGTADEVLQNKGVGYKTRFYPGSKGVVPSPNIMPGWAWIQVVMCLQSLPLLLKKHEWCDKTRMHALIFLRINSIFFL